MRLCRAVADHPRAWGSPHRLKSCKSCHDMLDFVCLFPCLGLFAEGAATELPKKPSVLLFSVAILWCKEIMGRLCVLVLCGHGVAVFFLRFFVSSHPLVCY